jgi:hypothetical protein
MTKRVLGAIIAASVLSLGLASSAKAGSIITVTLPEYNGAPDFDFNSADYPLAPVTIGDFSFAIPVGDSVSGGTISGTFGNADVNSTTAPSDYFVDNGTIEVAACDDPVFVGGGSPGLPCDSSFTPTAWSYTFTAADLANLSAEIAAGSIDFTVDQNFAIAVQTGTTTLTLDLAPEPATIFIFTGGLAGIALLRRFRKP